MLNSSDVNIIHFQMIKMVYRVSVMSLALNKVTQAACVRDGVQETTLLEYLMINILYSYKVAYT